MWELIHTSAPHGLRANTSGFCSVAWTHGLPANVISPLEQLSGYRLLFSTAEDPEGRKTPVEFAFRKVHYGNQTLRVVSRIAGTKLDYTGRSNKIAHHLLLEPEDRSQSPQGMAALCAAPENFRTVWEGEPALLALRRFAVAAAPALPPAWAWLEPWCRALAADFLADGTRPFYVELPPDLPPEVPLALIAGVIRHLPPEQRDELTFSTYFTQEIPGCSCYLRCCTADAPALQRLRRIRSDRYLTLSAPVPAPETALPAPPPESPASPEVPEVPAAAAPVPPSAEEPAPAATLSASPSRETGSLPPAEAPAARKNVKLVLPIREEEYPAVPHRGIAKILPWVFLLLIVLLLGMAAGIIVTFARITGPFRKVQQELIQDGVTAPPRTSPSSPMPPAPAPPTPPPAAVPPLPASSSKSSSSASPAASQGQTPSASAAASPAPSKLEPPKVAGKISRWTITREGSGLWRFRCGERSFSLPVQLWNESLDNCSKKEKELKESKDKMVSYWTKQNKDLSARKKEAVEKVQEWNTEDVFKDSPELWKKETLQWLINTGRCRNEMAEKVGNYLLLRDILNTQKSGMNISVTHEQWRKWLSDLKPPKDCEDLTQQTVPILWKTFEKLQGLIENYQNTYNTVQQCEHNRQDAVKSLKEKQITIETAITKKALPKPAMEMIQEKLKKQEKFDEEFRKQLEEKLNDSMGERK